ncbi:MAG TPA: hypothetical protein VJN93_12715 [Candidatus Acidoferrum sp.]|nr:hypothetical protein [Candidatus Acidoferrum sp.]
MITFVSFLVLGFFLGVRHATDADHVVAVTTIVSRERSIRAAAVIGGLWGVGHTITILAVGSAIVLFGIVIPARVGLTMELSVGLMLILLGIMNLSGILKWISENLGAAKTHRHRHRHRHRHGHGEESGNEAKIGMHTHSGESAVEERRESVGILAGLGRMVKRLGFYHALRPLGVGIVHGLAGSAAVALLVLTTIRVPMWAVVYLLVFGLGTVAGMMMITAAIAVPFAVSDKRFTKLNRGMGVASGLVSLVFGMFIVYQMGYVNGLWTAHPKWVPR